MTDTGSVMREPGEEREDEHAFPVPRRTLDAEPYWQGVREGCLRYQRCDSCHGAVFPPRSACPLCEGGHPLRWADSAGRGVVYSFSTVMRPPAPVWRARVPYTLGFIQLDEGYCMFSEILGRPEDLSIGARVRVVFPDRPVMLPVFELEGP